MKLVLYHNLVVVIWVHKLQLHPLRLVGYMVEKWILHSDKSNTINGRKKDINPRDLNDIIIGDIVSDNDLIKPRVITPDEVRNYQGELVQIRNVNIQHLIVDSEYCTDRKYVDCYGINTYISLYYLYND
eukprot:540052_1